MSSDTEHDQNDGPPDQPQEAENIKRREALGRFTTYTSPALLALLVRPGAGIPRRLLKRDITLVGGKDAEQPSTEHAPN